MKPEDAREACAEYGRQLARQAPPLTQEQIEAAARILCASDDASFPIGTNWSPPRRKATEGKPAVPPVSRTRAGGGA